MSILSRKTRNYQDRKFRIRIFMSLLFMLLMALLMPKNFVPDFHYETGKPWPNADLKAEFDVPVLKPTPQVEQERLKARKAAPPVFTGDTAVAGQVRTAVVAALDAYRREMDRYVTTAAVQPEVAQRMRQEYFIGNYSADPQVLLTGHASVDAWFTPYRAHVMDLLRDVYHKGCVDTLAEDLPQDVVLMQRDAVHMDQVLKASLLLRRNLPAFVKTRFTGTAEELLLTQRLVTPLLEADYRFNFEATEAERKRAESVILPYAGKVNKGEVIILKGERVTEELDMRIRSYEKVRTERFGRADYWATLLGQVIIMAILTALLLLYLRTNRPRIYFRNRKLALIFLLYLSVMALLDLIMRLSVLTQGVLDLNYAFMVPLCIVPIVLTAFFDSRFAFFGNIVMALMAGVNLPNGFGFFFIQLVAGTIAVYRLAQLRNRSDFFIALSYILVAYFFTFAGYHFYLKGSLTTIPWGNLALFLINIILTFLAYPFIYFCEKFFRITSDLSYVELLDTNHPLLRELSARAPGTFQHSLQVANLAEAVLNRIGGNGLQARVGALFHDIGKMKNPKFFIENLGDDDNPHQGMPYEESAAIIIRHVTDGVRMAQEHRLPPEVVEFIRTHHGTSVTDFFLRKYQGEHPDEEVDVMRFRYPGPLPFTREQAVVMLVDSVEAASRAMKEKTPEKLRTLVEKIIESKVSLRQFDNANLTFRDIEEAKHVILNQLLSIHHGRIEYPAAPPRSLGPVTQRDSTEGE